MSKGKKYLEITLFKGDMTQDGAVFRMNQMRMLMQAAAELRGLQYHEDAGSYALFGPESKMHEGTDVMNAFRKKVLTKVDMVGFMGETEIQTKIQTIIKLAEENKLTCGADIVQATAQELLMQNLLSVKTWIV